MSTDLVIGLERALDEPPDVLVQAKRFGLLCNQSSLDRALRNSHDVLRERFGDQLRALFSPQHGLWSTEQDNMIESAHGTFDGLPVYSLYSETRKPTPAMLRDLDLLVVDIPDVGTRVYTFAWTIVHCMQACAERGIPLLLLDRPNPLGGEVAEGPCLDMRFESFVGLADIPMRHGLTLGELARYCNETLSIGCDLHVLAMRGYDRTMLWPACERPWVPPSPNLPRFEGVLCYPGQVLLEGTNLSEGRGTTTPFEQFGAPFIDGRRWLDAAREHHLDGVTLRAVAFQPTFQKWQEQDCHGLWMHPTDAATLRSYRVTIVLLRVLRELYPTAFAWREPPYEYEETLLPIDILAGDERARRFVDGELEWSQLDDVTQAPADWWQRCRAHLLYGDGR